MRQCQQQAGELSFSTKHPCTTSLQGSRTPADNLLSAAEPGSTGGENPNNKPCTSNGPMLPSGFTCSCTLGMWAAFLCSLSAFIQSEIQPILTFLMSFSPSHSWDTRFAWAYQTQRWNVYLHSRFSNLGESKSSSITSRRAFSLPFSAQSEGFSPDRHFFLSILFVKESEEKVDCHKHFLTLTW